MFYLSLAIDKLAEVTYHPRKFGLVEEIPYRGTHHYLGFFGATAWKTNSGRGMDFHPLVGHLRLFLVASSSILEPRCPCGERKFGYTES